MDKDLLKEALAIVKDFKSADYPALSIRYFLGEVSMFSKLSQLFATSQQSRQRQKLTKPEYGFLFDSPPTNEWVV